MNNVFSTAGGQIELTRYTGFGGNSFNSKHLSHIFNYDKPYNFGMSVARMYSSSNRFTNKIFTGSTLAKGKYKVSPVERYTWALEDDDIKALTVMAYVEAGNPTPGYNGAEFGIVLEEDYLHEPDVIVGADPNFPLEIVGYPQNYTGGYFLYTVRMQDGNVDAYIPSDLIQEGQIFRKRSTSVATELNDQFGTTQFGSIMELECHIGAYAEQIKVSDKLIMNEIRAAKNEGKNDKWSCGYTMPLKTKSGKTIQKGTFITMAESELLEQIEADREWQCQYGRASIRPDHTGKFIKRTAPGRRQLQLDGHIFYHNGSITAQDLKDYLMDIWFAREDENQRKITIETGTGGSDLFHLLLAAESNSFVTIDTHFIKQHGTDPRHLSFGARFVHFWAGNGVEVDLVLDPMKDDIRYCGRTHPDNPKIPIDSYRMDVYDFGSSAGEDNITMIMQEGQEYYAIISGLIDPKSGYRNGYVPNGSKEVTYQRETTGSPFIRDTSRIGAIIYEPEYIAA